MLVAPTADCSAGMSKDLHALLRTQTWFPDGDAGKAFAYALAQWIYVALTTQAVVAPSLLVAPSGGGPVTGTGTIS